MLGLVYFHVIIFDTFRAYGKAKRKKKSMKKRNTNGELLSSRWL
jgi:hypothetical protein